MIWPQILHGKSALCFSRKCLLREAGWLKLRQHSEHCNGFDGFRTSCDFLCIRKCSWSLNWHPHSLQTTMWACWCVSVCAIKFWTPMNSKPHISQWKISSPNALVLRWPSRTWALLQVRSHSGHWKTWSVIGATCPVSSSLACHKVPERVRNRPDATGIGPIPVLFWYIMVCSLASSVFPLSAIVIGDVGPIHLHTCLRQLYPRSRRISFLYIICFLYNPWRADRITLAATVSVFKFGTKVGLEVSCWPHSTLERMYRVPRKVQGKNQSKRSQTWNECR